MKKLNWQIDFLAHVETKKNEPFVWGTFDCVLFAADCVALMGNEDPAALSRGKYVNELQAKKHLAITYGSLEGAWDAHLQRLPNNHMLQRGDVVLFESELGSTSGIYWNGGVFAPTLDGVRFFDEMHNKITAAWRV